MIHPKVNYSVWNKLQDFSRNQPDWLVVKYAT